jgi:hypothetical protein
MTVDGAVTTCVRNLDGQALDSASAGDPGGDAHFVLTWRQLVLGDVSRAFLNRYGILPRGPRAHSLSLRPGGKLPTEIDGDLPSEARA